MSLLQPVLAALFFGCMHALAPCAHSWPMLLPFVGPRKPVWRPALLFGSGVLVASAVIGATLGGAASALPDAVQKRAEEITGVILVILGAVILVRPRLGHLGHLHGACDPDAPRHCEHAAHEPRRFGRYGAGLGLFLLGFINLFIPCWTNISAASIALSGGTVEAGILLFVVYGAATALTMTAILWFFWRGSHVLERLRGGRAETLLVRASGLFLVLCGLALLLHWHVHDHAH